MVKQKPIITLAFFFFALTVSAVETVDAEVDVGESVDCKFGERPIAASPLPEAEFPLAKQEKAYQNLKRDVERDIEECTSSLAFAKCIDLMERYCSGVDLVARIAGNKDVSRKLMILKDRTLKFQLFLIMLRDHQGSSKESKTN